MNELERWGNHSRPTGLVKSRDDRAHARAVAAVIHEARETAVKIDAAAANTGRVMDRLAALDSQRHSLANGNPTLDAVLMRIEVGFAIVSEQHLRNQNAGFGL
jgi:hypothetical protein